jgi:predicted mannosyl-3-phosphoglycerate phosphatase (HAD superfamily)
MARPVIFLDVDGVLHPGTYEAHKCQEMRLEHSEVILELMMSWGSMHLNHQIFRG